MGNSNNNHHHTTNEAHGSENISASREVGCFCISNANVDISNEMHLSDNSLPISQMNPREIVR